MAYTACTSKIARSIQGDCDKPLVGGYTGLGVLVDAETATIVKNATNPRMIESITAAETIAVDNMSVIAAFEGSNKASTEDSGTRTFTKTVAFRIPQRGAGVSKDIVEAICNSRGLIFIAEKQDNNPEGKYEVIGELSPLKVNGDGISQSESENNGAIMVTMSCNEPWFEQNLVGALADGKPTLANAKQAFSALLEAAL